MYQFLLKQFLKQTGRKPNNLENILLKQKASKQAIDERKIVSMSDRSSVNPNKPILGGKNIEETEEQIRQRLIDQNKKGIESLRNKNKPDDMAKGGRAGYAVGNQVMPAVDQRMNVDYNTLVDQNTAQRGFMDNWRNHAITSQKMKGKAGLESIPNYGMQSGYDFKKNFQDMNPKVAAGLSLGYQGLTEGLGMFSPNNPNFLNPIKTGKTIYNDYQKNVEGILNAEANNLTPKEQADRNKYLEVKDPVVEPSAMPQGSPGQLNPTLTSNEIPGAINSLINVNKPTMADVAGPAATGGGYAGDSNNVVSEDPLGLIQQVNKLRNGQTPSSNYSYQPEEGGYVQWNGTSYSVVDPEQIKRDVGLASGGRAGYYGGGQAMVGEDLSEIGHGSDALMARNMQIAPGGQATTSTGLNYLLGQDNDTVRVPYAGGGMSKRAFLKLLGAFGAGAAGLKSGILGLGKGAGKEVVKEVAKEAATGGAPPHFLKLVAKIKALGDDVTETAATAERQNVKQYKDFEMTEDVSTGEIQIFKNSQSDEAIDRFASENANEEVFMRYKPGKGQADETTKGKTILDEYEENTSYISNNRENTGEILEEVSGVPDDIFEEVGEAVPEIIRKTKADGGRIGYAGGKKVVEGLASLIKKKFGDNAITTADKLKTPQKTLDRDMFSKFKDRNPDPKREITDDEFQDLMEDVGDLDAYNFDGTIGSANKIRKEAKDYQDYMYKQYKMGKLDPVAGDKSPARKRFLEKKLEEMEGSGNSKLMTRDEIEELSTFDLGTEMDDFVLSSAEKKGKKLADSMSDAEIDLRDEFPGIDDNLIKNILIDDNPQRIAEVKQTMREGLKMQEMGKGDDEILQILKNAKRTKQASGGLATMLGE